MEQVEVRLEPESTGFAGREPAGRGELRGWLQLPGGAAFDPAALLFAVDAFPPATFDIEFSGWVPTLELTVYVRALPEPGPVRVLQRAQLIQGTAGRRGMLRLGPERAPGGAGHPAGRCPSRDVIAQTRPSRDLRRRQAQLAGGCTLTRGPARRNDHQPGADRSL